MTFAQIISICVFVVVMAFVVTEKLHRAVVAMAGAVVLLFVGAITFEQSVNSIDFNTIGVLIGMMLYVAVVKTCGLFEFIAVKSAKMAKGNPWRIMLYFTLITAVLSALLDNVTTVLLMGPMTVMVCRILKLNPVPFFLTEILASNIGGTATLIGDPPNIMIGSQAGLSFMDFLQYNGPVVVIILVAVIIVFRFKYGRKMGVDEKVMAEIMELDEKDQITDTRLFYISIVMIAAVTVGFMFHGALGVESSIVALAAAVIVLIAGKGNFEKAIKDVEWSTIAFFAGLFVIVGALQVNGIIDMLAGGIMSLTGGDPVVTMIVILWMSALLSPILDNIPFVATMVPIIMTLQASGMDVFPLWWALSLGACLGGNGSLVGASANVVLAALSARHGHPITFMGYLKECLPIMLLTVAISTIYLLVIF